MTQQQELLDEIVSRFEADGNLLRRTDDGEPVLRASSVCSRATVSPLSVEAKKGLAEAKGIEWREGAHERVVILPLSDETPDRHGTVLMADGWRFQNWDANSVILAQHNSWDLPIGWGLQRKGARILGNDGKRRKGHLVHGLFSYEDLNPEAERYYRNWMAGFVRMSSVGFIPKSWRRATKKEVEKNDYEPDTFILEDNELAELSVVSVGSNPSMVGRADAIACIRAFASASGESVPVLGRADLEALYGKEAVAEAGVELPERQAVVSSAELLAAADRIRAAIAEPIKVAGPAFEEFEEEPESDGERSAAEGGDEPDDLIAQARALIEEDLELEDGELDQAEPEVRELDGTKYVPLAALEAAQVQRELLDQVVVLLAASLQVTPSGEADGMETSVLARLLGPVTELKTVVDELREEVQQLRSAAPVAPSGDEHSAARDLHALLLDSEPDLQKAEEAAEALLRHLRGR